MVKRKYCFNEEEIESLQSKGRGLGVGRDYLPWILAHEINSIGLTSLRQDGKQGVTTIACQNLKPSISIFWNGLIVSLISGSSFLSIITLLLKLQKTQALVIRGFVKLDLTPF